MSKFRCIIHFFNILARTKHGRDFKDLSSPAQQQIREIYRNMTREQRKNVLNSVTR